ncbi:hypothetical protein EON65_03730 [archaeon]|nr:MAG: hypothetical protein EON65_03730 [archaeon]
MKKRLKEASKQEDMKVAKKARKLAEDTIGQKNTMLKHLSNVPTAPKPSTRGPTSKLLVFTFHPFVLPIIYDFMCH